MKNRKLLSLRPSLVIGLVAALSGCEDVAKADYTHAAADLRDPIANLSELSGAIDTYNKAASDGDRLNAQMAVGVACEKSFAKVRALRVEDKRIRDDHVLVDLGTLSAAVRAYDDAIKPCDRAALGGGRDYPGTLMCGKICIQQWPAIVEAIDKLAEDARTKQVNVPRLGTK